MYPNPYGNQPNAPPQGPGYPQQPPSYPPTPYPPAPGSNNSAPYPTSGFPTPPQPGFSPYPQSSPYPQPGGPSGYQPAFDSPYPSSAPYPGALAPSGYPGAPAPSGYPGAPAPTGYPGAPPPSGYPGAPAPTGYPSASAPTAGYPGSTGGYPPTSSGYPGYPPTGSSAPYPGTQPSTGYPPNSQVNPSYPSTGGYPSSGYPGSQPATSAMYQQPQDVPTLRGDGPFDATADASALRKAMKGFGTDEKAIIQILGKRTNAQRQQIAMAYKTGFGRDLISDLKSELGGRLEDVVIALMTERYAYMAQALHKAMAGMGTKETFLVDILCTCSNQEVRYLNGVYQQTFGRSIEQDLAGDTSGYFRRILVSMTTGGRDENPVADPAIAAQDAQNLYKAGEKRMGTDEAAFNMVLATRSYANLRLMFHEYEKLSGHSFEKAIQREFSGDVEDAMLAIVKCARSRSAYFAERLKQTMKGFGTKDDELIFIIVTRAEVDLETIKSEYQRMFGKSLVDDVSSDTSGDYKKILKVLLGY